MCACVCVCAGQRWTLPAWVFTVPYAGGQEHEEKVIRKLQTWGPKCGCSHKRFSATHAHIHTRMRTHTHTHTHTHVRTHTHTQMHTHSHTHTHMHAHTHTHTRMHMCADTWLTSARACISSSWEAWWPVSFYPWCVMQLASMGVWVWM